MEVDSQFLTDLIDALPVALFCKNYTSGIGEFVYWNHQAEITWGLKKDDVIGKSDYDFFPTKQADHFKKKDLETIESGGLIFIAEEPVDSPALGTIMVRTWKVPLIDQQGRKFMLGMSIDISEQKKLEAQLEKEKQNAINASKMVALGEMAGGIAHEINNPLSILMMCCDLLKDHHETGTLSHESFGDTVGRMYKTTERISKVVRGFLNISRASRLEDMSVTSLGVILDDVFGLCSEKFKAHGIQLSRKGDVACYDTEITCNRVELSQVILNLLSNAHDAIKELSEQWIQVEITEDHNNLIVYVTDSGSGISAKLKDKIFQPFFTSKKIGEGTGIGLSISNEIMKRHQGSISLNETHEHTQFALSIPKGRRDYS